MRPGTHPGLLSTIEQRCELLGLIGADAVCVVPFTRELAAMTPEEFVDHVLVERFRARAVTVGENFRFGHRASGDTETLADLGVDRGFVVDAEPLVAGEGGVWSSTYIRGLIRAGDVASATYSLGRPHRLEGTVVHGDKRGRELGYPTANVSTTPHAAVPADGVYAALARARSRTATPRATRPPSASAPTRPSTASSGGSRRTCSTVDDLDVYGRHVALDFVERIRGQVKFDGIEPLMAQMAADVEATRVVLGDGSGG